MSAIPGSFRPGSSALRLPLVAALLSVLCASPASAGEVFSRPPSPTGGVNTSSWVAPDGSDSDMYAWDDFTLAATQTITEVRWRGGYEHAAPFGKVYDFRVSFFDSIAGGFQPYIVALPENEGQEVTIASFHTNSAAEETYVGTVNGIAMYDYRFVLPQSVTLQGGVKYWFRVVGVQPVYPDWGVQTGLGGDGSYFRYGTGLHMFQSIGHDLNFSLHATWADMGQAMAGAAGAPHLSGAGTLAAGSSCSLTVAGAAHGAPATLVCGLGQLDAPFKGGTMVPDPLLLVAGLATDGSGTLSFPFVMPAGVPSGTDLTLQLWIADATGPKGFTATNGLVGTTP